MLRTQNDIPFSHCEHRKVCGNPFFPFRVLRILSCFALRMTYRFVIVVRVSGGHLCEAEAPTEPAGETTVRCLAIRPLSLRSRVNGCGNPFFFSITDFFARSARNKKRGGYIAVSFLLVSLDVEINPRFYRWIVKRAELQQKWRGECQAERL